jgi:hypothetical protein
MEIVEGYITNRFGNRIKGDDWFWKEPVAEESIDTVVDASGLTPEELDSVMSPAGYAMHRIAEAASSLYQGARNLLGANETDKQVEAVREYAK